MSDPKGWTADRVRQHLRNAVELEMWTVPLYLTAAYSIAAPVDPSTSRPEFAPVPAKPDGSPDFSRFNQQDYNQYAFNSVLSVAIQEMLHVELAANILNAVRPRRLLTSSRSPSTGLASCGRSRSPARGCTPSAIRSTPTGWPSAGGRSRTSPRPPPASWR
jgi:Ferritin-like